MENNQMLNDVFNFRVSETSAMFYDEEEAIEDRKAFVRNLGILASQTRDGVISMELFRNGDSEEYVEVTYHGGTTKQINVRLDSYSAIVRDVFKYL